MITLEFKRAFSAEESEEFATSVLVRLLSYYNLDNADDSTLLTIIENEADELTRGYITDVTDNCLVPVKEEIKKVLKKLENIL